MDVERQDTQQGEYERERYEERESEKYDIPVTAILKKRHEAFMRELRVKHEQRMHSLKGRTLSVQCNCE